MRKLLTLLSYLWFFQVVSAQEEPYLKLDVTEDFYIQGTDDSRYSNTSVMRVKNGYREGYMFFNMTDEGIQSANGSIFVELTLRNDNSELMPEHIFRSQFSISGINTQLENLNTMTWSTRPTSENLVETGYYTLTDAAIDLSRTDSIASFRIDVTDFINGVITDGVINTVGLRLHQSAGDAYPVSGKQGFQFEQNNGSHTSPNSARLLFYKTKMEVPKPSIHALEFGILPNDEIDDKEAITEALKDPRLVNGGILLFDAGVYNLIEADDNFDPLIEVNRLYGITIQGATDIEGNPATVFERNMSAPNAKESSNKIIAVSSSRNFSIKNILFRNNPEFSSAGVVTKVDKSNDYVEVEIFDGLPHFDGMKPCSANGWDLSTRKLLPIEALTIGTNKEIFPSLNKLAGDNPRLYRVNGYGLADKLKAGDGMSWHFYVDDGKTQLDIKQSQDILLENIHMYNSRQMSVGTGSCKNMTFRKCVFRPSGNQLAVGARDCFHLIMSDGKLLMEDCYIKGYRWDPINCKSKIGRVEEIIDSKTIKATFIIGYIPQPDYRLAGDSVIFYTGEKADQVGYVDSDEWNNTKITDRNGETRYELTLKFSEEIPATLSTGDGLGVYKWLLDEAIIRNCTFEGNFGRPILYQGHNLHVDNSFFDNNAYANIALGPINNGEGPWVRNVTITNNTFTNSTWLSTTAHERNGSVRIYENFNTNNEPYNYNGEPYNQNILIKNNTFSGINYTTNYAAINVENACEVTICNNVFENTTNDIQVAEQNTADIHLDCDGATTTQTIGITGNVINIYPNPITDGCLNVKSSIPVNKVIIYNVQGQLVLVENTIANWVDVSGLPGGAYFAKFETPQNCFTEKFIIRPGF